MFTPKSSPEPIVFAMKDAPLIVLSVRLDGFYRVEHPNGTPTHDVRLDELRW